MCSILLIVLCSYLLQAGSDPKLEADKRRAEAGYMIQPHLLCIGNQKALGRMFLVVGDSSLLELSRNATPTNAVDLLLKTYFTLHLHYPLGWKNAFRFFQIYIYGIPSEKRESSFPE